MIFNVKTPKGLLIQIGIMVTIGILLVLFFFYMYLPSITNQDETITVPDLEGTHFDQLEDNLVRRDLRYEITADSGFVPGKPALTILKQYPKPGSRVKEQRKVYLTLNSAQPPKIRLPKITDISLKSALVILDNHGLQRGNLRYEPSTFNNLVLEVSMDGKEINEGDSIFKGSTIDFVVGQASGRRIVAPEVLGYPLDEAGALLLGYGFKIGDTIWVPQADSLEPGYVVRQIPPPLEEVYSGSLFDLWVVEVDSSKINAEPDEN